MRHKKPRLAALATTLAVAVAALAVAAGATARPAANKTFAYANVSDSSPLFKTVGDLLVTDGKKVGITVNRFDNNFDASTALNNAHLMVQQKPDLIIDWTGTESIGKSVGAVFKRANIPCIAVNQQITGCPYFNLQNRFLGLGAEKIVAPIMKKRNWTAKDTTVVFLFNPGAGAEVNSNGRYFYAFLSKSIKGMAKATPTSITDKTTKLGSLPNLVQINGQDALQPSYQVMKTELTLLPKDRHLVVFTQNDDSALGAWRAITQSGRQKNTLIIGQGADADGLKNLRTNPSWVAEGSVFFELWPEYLLAMGVSVLNGTKTPALTLAPQTVLSKQNVAQYYGKKGLHPIKAPPLAKVDRYLIKAGILQKFGNVPGVK